MSSFFDPDVAPPTVGALLRLAWQTFRRRIYESVQAAGFDDLQAVEVQLFRYPTIGDRRPGQIAEEAGLSKQAINDLLRQLERKGYLTLVPDPTDGRARLIKLTDRGSDLMEWIRAVSAEVARDWAEIIGERRLAGLHNSLVEIVVAERKSKKDSESPSVRS